MLYRDKGWMLDQFSVPGTHIEDVAKRAGCDEKTIRRWLIRHNVRARSISENAHFRQGNHVYLNEYVAQVIDGELLGDGNLHSENQWSAVYQHNTKYRSYLEWLNIILRQSGIESWIGVNGRGQALRSRHYVELRAVWGRWYQSSKKIVPPDLIITPTVGLHWYLGDGCLVKDARGCRNLYCIRLSTDAFDLADIERLMAQLKEHSPYAVRYQKHVEGRGYRIVVKDTLLDWIGACPEPIKELYGYKWNNPEVINRPKIWRNQYSSGLRDD